MTVKVDHSGLDIEHEGGPLHNIENNVHDGHVVFSVSQMVVGYLFDLLVVKGRVLGGVWQQERGVLEWGVGDWWDGHVNLNIIGKGDLAYSKDLAEVVLEKLDHLHDGYDLTQ